MKLAFIVLIITVSATIFKIVANVFNYKYDTTGKILYGAIQHVFEVAFMGTPFIIGMFGPLSFFQWTCAVIGWSMMYTFLMDLGFNIGTRRPKPLQYIGFTSWRDRWLRKVFKISNEFDPSYNDLTAKQKQKENFRKSIIAVIKFVFLVGGYIIITQLIK